ncbi:alpha/beta hydrolase [Streptomyces durbertensis]|uniref:Alpha/beta hydrolase n=1 Tax=Streptomyces durbertensis TaxID=2448886 RepID=A0ABR6ELJ8_9ACTN|nr:alpha/beta hydrolase [Streptomyces durbertensis]MBB1246200.1 alpha/beta hydrolase [Streptomyces durbertensis]
MNDWSLSETYHSTAGEVRWNRLGNGPEAVVLLHGTPFSSFVWRGVARSFAPHFSVYVWDMPGYGVSEKRAGQDVSLDAQGLVFTELLTHWGLTDPHVVAHDFGGAVALRASLLHGAPYRRLALVDPVALAPWGSPFFRLVGANTSVFEQLPPAMHAALVREYVRSASHPGLAPDVAEQLVAPWLGEVGQPAFYRQIAQADQRYTDELDARFGDLRPPTLVCWGAEDRWIPVERGHELVGRLPKAELTVIPGAGHLVQEDAPAELAATLFAFLKGLS